MTDPETTPAEVGGVTTGVDSTGRADGAWSEGSDGGDPPVEPAAATRLSSAPPEVTAGPSGAMAVPSGRLQPGRSVLAIRIGAVIVGLVPLAWLMVDLAAGRLSANPIEELQQRTGDTAVVMLLLTLAVTPVRRLLQRSGATGLAWAAYPLRRTFGLFAAFYAVLHFLVFFVLDYGLRVGLIFSEFPQKPFIIAGAGALLILVVLAVTSTRRWKRRLGPWWRRLHRLVYPATLLVALHYLWALKAAEVIDLVLLALLFGVLTLRLFTLHATDPEM